jgi:glycosyltransferase involved in cell wall biosynthesis
VRAPMTNLKLVEPMPKTLDRDAWHKPLVSIIVTHHNYSAHLEDCLRSMLDQTHVNWECVVVDDASSDTHRAIADLLVETLREPRIRFLALDDNVGQIPAFYAGLDATSGEFVCALDPDDRYGKTFLEEMVAAHVNPIRAVPLVSCEQMLLRGNAVISGVVTGHASKLLADDDRVGHCRLPDLRFFPAMDTKWNWSSTSGMMFRRPALIALRPHRPLGYRGDLDAWVAPGAHMLGGSMFLNRPLIYRGIHGDNDWLREDFWSQSQRPKFEPRGAKVRADVIEAIIANGYEADLARARQGKRTLPQRLRRSMEKRWRRWLGRAA